MPEIHEEGSSDYTQRRIDKLRGEYLEAERALIGAVIAACPGPHRLVQHRDGRLPWCPKCRRTEQGHQV